jgi:hypothetical protein
MLLKIQDYYRLYYGGNQITIEYLHPLALNEPTESLELRFRKASYMNIVAKVIDTYLGYCFSAPVKQSEVRYFDLESALRKSVFHSMLGGSCLAVALPNDPEIKIFPRMKYEPIDDVPGGYTAEACINGEEVKLRILADKILVLDEKDTQTSIEYARNADSVVEIMWNEEGASLVRDVAPYAIKIFNYDSIADKQASNSAMWVSSGPSLPSGQKGLIPFQHVTRNTGDTPEPNFHAPDAVAMENTDKRIDKFILRAGKTVGLEREFAETYNVASGAAQQMQMVSTNAITLMIASANVRAINRVAEGGGKLSGNRTGGTIALEPSLTPQARTELLNQLKIGADMINTAEAAEEYAREIIKVTLSGAPEKALQAAIDSVKGKGLDALRNLTVQIQ